MNKRYNRKRAFLYASFLSLAFLTAICAQAQDVHGTVTATVTDKSNEQPLSHATVVLREGKDSTVVKSAFTEDDGSFRLDDIEQGTYRLSVTYLGYQRLEKVVAITAEKPLAALGTLAMAAGAVALDAVVVKDQQPPVKMLKDTLQFNAGSFKTRENAVVEDLLKKLPGVEVDQNGNITAQGEQVQEVLVDGKPFFGDDPKITTKNLPADIIDQIQLFDKTSDQAAFTGIDDGNTKKAINLKLKKDKKKGLFGRATAGYGSDNRYQVNAMFNRFQGDQQLSFIGGGNNVNNLGFTFRDIRSIMGGGGGGRRGGRGGGGGFGGGGFGGMNGVIAPSGGGITTNWMGGLNYRDNWNSKLQVYGSYFANSTQTDAEEKSSQQNISKDTTFYYNQYAASTNRSVDHRFNLNMEYTIDSMSSLIFRPSISYTTNDYSSGGTYESLDEGKALVNSGRSSFTSHTTSPNLNGNLLYRRRLNNKGRTFSINVNGGYNSSDATAYNQSAVNYFIKGDSSTVNLDQQNILNTDSRSWGTGITYTEPLYKDHFLELEYSYNRNISNSDKRTYNFDPVSKGYDEYDSVYSNTFHNTFATSRGGLNFIANKEKYDYTVGVSLQRSLMSSEWAMHDSTITQNTLNFYPLFNFHYNFSEHNRLRLQYRGSTRQPSISQLQPVPDNSDQLNVKLGNPDLKPSFSNSVRLNYNSFNPGNYKSLFASLDFSTVSNQIVNSSRYNDSGQQVIMPVNVNGTYDLNGNVFFELPVKKLNLRFHPGTSVRYSHDVGFINGEKNLSNNFSLGQRLRMSYDLDDKLDMDMGGRVDYNNVHNSLTPGQDQQYFSYNFSLDFEWHLPADFLIGSDFDYTANTGRAAGYNQDVAMWNAYIGKEFFKKKQGMLKLQVFDLLDQNVSIERNVTASYIEDTQSKVLSRYFLLTFTYNLNRFSGRNGGPRRGPGGGGGRYWSGPR